MGCKKEGNRQIMASTNEGLISSIERFAVHDGSGIRTLVFLKGCPLRCLWCNNPEGQLNKPELMVYPERCIGCEACLEVCPVGAISMEDGRILTDRAKCLACGRCAEACYANARTISVRWMSIDQVIKGVIRDLPFYRKSGGGVTLSGGEPTLQTEFARNLLRELQEQGISTAIETTGYLNWRRFSTLVPYLDQILYDLKHTDCKKHVGRTGVPNELILKNLTRLSKTGISLIVRIPLIPGFNTADCELGQIFDVIRDLGVTEVHLLPYHSLGKGKYAALGREYGLDGIGPPTAEQVDLAKELCKTRGLKVSVGG